MTKESFAVWLEEMLEKTGMTQEQLAIEVGTSKQAISDYYKGKRNPRLDSLENIAKVFGVTVALISQEIVTCEFCTFSMKDVFADDCRFCGKYKKSHKNEWFCADGRR